jgi:hypothetical protein
LGLVEPHQTQTNLLVAETQRLITLLLTVVAALAEQIIQVVAAHFMPHLLAVLAVAVAITIQLIIRMET